MWLEGYGRLFLGCKEAEIDEAAKAFESTIAGISGRENKGVSI